MLDDILKLNNSQNSVKEFCDSIRQGVDLAVFGVNDSFKNYLVSLIHNKVLFITKDILTAKNYQKLLSGMTDKKVVVLPPKDELLMPFRAFSKDAFNERIIALTELKEAKIIITTVESLLQKYIPISETFNIKKGDSISESEVINKLTCLGYVREESAETKGSFSVRGDIIDICPLNVEEHIKLDFFGDEIESIKLYDFEIRKVVSFLNEATLTPAREEKLTKDERLKLKGAFLEEFRNSTLKNKNKLKETLDEFLTAFETEDERYLSAFDFLSEKACSLFDIISKDSVIVFDESKRVFDFLNLYISEFNERFDSYYKEGALFSVMKNAIYPYDIITDNLPNFTSLAMQTLSTGIPFFNPEKIINPSVSTVVNYRLDFNEIFNDVDNWLKTGYSVLLFSGTEEKAERLCFDLSGKGICSKINGPFGNGVNIVPAYLDSGFIFHEEKIAVIGSGNLFSRISGDKKPKRKKSAFFSAPEAGDYAVHEVHGIGRVLGSKKITSTEGTKDYVAVEYYGGDVLYVPVEQMDILSRYLGGEQKPKLSKIGGRDFESVKNKVKESLKKMSFDLKKLYQERNALVGFKFKEDGELQRLFANAFSFEDTADQIVATLEIIKDMSEGKVMDRLLCGDVGFGKTEVAFRAAFLSIINGKQVAMLAPTTILTEQHFNTAVKRFEGFGINIAVLNRFKTAKQQKEIIEKLKEGKIDFIIGTHRLLGKDVSYKDLGLLILDEEQRFGVEHKEKIKLIKKNVDTLTLSATPIPRTLHMALSGIRSISTINTPPKKRLPVQTYVTEETDMLIRDVVLKEYNRGGQTFILYNRVESIDSFAKRVRDIVPEVKITVVHGQMEERFMEKNVMSFYNGEYDVLISTTIIENGIDLPNANSLIVIDADRLGLSTLYQLKGRVGRSDRLAYAYFTFKREKILSETAYSRLNAIIEFTEMGSGIKIAMRDLEIRGAGNVLGVEQHGHMDKIGYELYSKLLREELEGKEEIIPELDIRVTAYIPDSYIESSTARMDTYKEIAELGSFEEEKEFKETLSDNYGEIPKETEDLINIAMVKGLAKKFRVSEINVKKEEVSLVFETIKDFANENLQRTIEKYKDFTFISMTNKPSIMFKRKNRDNGEMLKLMLEFLRNAESLTN